MDVNLQFEFLNEMIVLKTRVLDGIGTFIQLSGYLARVCQLAIDYSKKLKNL